MDENADRLTTSKYTKHSLKAAPKSNVRDVCRFENDNAIKSDFDQTPIVV